jgi:hypothetical protein
MPSAIDHIIKRKVIKQWISGVRRDKIASENNIGAGTVTSIINNYKVGLDNSDFESVRELAVEIRKQGLNLADLASHFRLYNYFRKSGASEEETEAFISKVNSSNVPQEKLIEYVNQLFDISKAESIPPAQVPAYINKKLEEKQKIDEEIKQADAVLQSKNVSVEAINEHLKLNEELDKQGMSTQDIDKLLNLLLNAKEYGFDSKLIVRKLRSIKRLEKKRKAA